MPAGGAGAPCLEALRGAVAAAEEAEARTPEQLPLLAEAGVTDAGGEGICVILRGMLAALTGDELAVPPTPERPLATLSGHDGESFGYCTEFLLEAGTAVLDATAVRRFAIESGARSVVVVGDAAAVRVHVHTEDPEALLTGAGRFGTPGRVKVEDMSAQHARFAATGSGAGARIAVLALSPGPGFDAIFASLGAIPVRLDDNAKPAAGTIAAWADELGRADVFVLPNHPNVMLAAEQATGLTRCTLTVVPARTAPQGIAAALAYDPDVPVRTGAEAMARALANVRTVEVTRAAAARTADGVRVEAGQPIALVDGRLVATATTVHEALVAALAAAGAEEGGLVTVYTGVEAECSAEELTGALEERFAGAEVQVLPGGQRLYDFIASVEP